MAKHIFIVSCVSFILAIMLSVLGEIAHENLKLHVVYMGSLPKRPYSPTSHHFSLMKQVVGGYNATNSIIHNYKRSFNGFAAMLTNQQREKLTQMKGVISVFPSKTLQTHTTRSWDFMGFPQSVQRRQTSEGDVVIGFLDTGIWPESDSFNDHGFGPVPKKWKGTCEGGKNFTCNKKIIGARFYVEESARDNEGHGTHTTSIAAGNKIYNANFYGFAQGTARGGVPSARVAIYKVCSKGCNEANILAAFDDAITDGVDIISISLGWNNPINFVEDVIAIGSFHAMGKRILTVNSAGNHGPDLSTTSSVAPWILTVASSTIDRRFIDKVVLGNGKTLVGKSINTFTSNGTTFPIATQNGDSEKCLKEYASNCICLDSHLVKGKIVLCGENFQGEYLAYDNEAIGVISRVDTGYDYPPDVTILPSLTLHSHDYALVDSYTNSTKDPQAKILKSETIEDHSAPIVAMFSSRGPNEIVPEILKPDVSAPGVNILAAFSPISPPSLSNHDKRSVKFNILSGTSMSCPHVAGITTYLKTFHLDWSPAAIKSAIMTSAQPMKSPKDHIGEYAYGSGHVNPVKAVNPGLIYDIEKEDYIQMLCNLGYDNNKIKQISGENSTCFGVVDRSLVRNINYPAFAIDVQPNVTFNVTFNRTVTNVGLENSNYKATILQNPQINIKVAPEVLFFKSLNEKKSFVVTITSDKLLSENVLTSSLIWSDGIHNVRSPIVVNINSK